MPRFVLHVAFTIKPELADAIEPQLREAMNVSVKEPGTEYYVVTRDKESTNKFRVFEIYKSPEAFDAHHDGAAFVNLMKWVKEHDAVLEFATEKHELLEDVEKGIVGV